MNEMQHFMQSYLFSGKLFNTASQFYSLVLIFPAEVSTESSNSQMFLYLNISGDASSHAQEQYDSMDTDEGGETGPARCKSLALILIIRGLYQYQVLNSIGICGMLGKYSYSVPVTSLDCFDILSLSHDLPQLTKMYNVCIKISFA